MKWFNGARARRYAVTFAGLSLAAASLAACSGESAGSDDAVLDVQFKGPPIAGLDPAKSGGGGALVYNTLAYDSLIHMQPDGTLVPGLATSWGWVDDTHTVFELTLRDGVEFSDGTAMTADGVAQWLVYFRDAKSTLSSTMAALAKAEAVDASTVRITLSETNPDLPVLLSQQFAGGLVAAPAGMEKPGSLDAATNGTGPYMLDPSETVAGDHYTYVENPNYWNPNGTVYDKVVVHAITDPNTVVSAMSSGQIDVALGSPSTAKAAEDADIDVQAVPGRVVSLYLLDRDGTIVPALGQKKVRQAINYAIDRAAISKALNPDGYADPTTQIGVPQQEGFDEALDTVYPYDPAKAKQLLVEAGYPKGFGFEVTCSATLGLCDDAQAIAGYLAKVGIDMSINEESEISTFNQKFAAGEVPAVIFQAHGPAYRTAYGLTQQDVLANPFNTKAPDVQAQFEKVASAPEGKIGPAWRGLVEVLADEGWFAPIERPYALVYSKGVDNVVLDAKFPGAFSVIDPTGDFTWQPAS